MRLIFEVSAVTWAIVGAFVIQPIMSELGYLSVGRSKLRNILYVILVLGIYVGVFVGLTVLGTVPP